MLGFTNDSHHVYTGGEVEALIERIDRAREEGDGAAFRAALSGLAAAKTPAARRKLLALAGDGTLQMPYGSCAMFFVFGLSDCDLPGVAGAARSRVETDAGGRREWARLLAIHGGADDIEFLLARGFADEVARSSNPAALSRVLALLEEGRLSSQGLAALTRFHPDEAFPWHLRQLREESAADGPPGRLDLFGESVTLSHLPEAKAFLLSLSDPGWRLAAVWSVVRMAGRGLDTSGLEDFLDLPVSLIEQADGTTPADTLRKAAGLIGGNRMLWTARALAELSNAAERLAEGELSDLLPEIAGRVRAGMESPWR